jgi:hypothetical protein
VWMRLDLVLMIPYHNILYLDALRALSKTQSSLRMSMSITDAADVHKCTYLRVGTLW